MFRVPVLLELSHFFLGLLWTDDDAKGNKRDSEATETQERVPHNADGEDDEAEAGRGAGGGKQDNANVCCSGCIVERERGRERESVPDV